MEELKALWNRLDPKQRQKTFRISNLPFVYAPWDELSDREQALITNAARIIGERLAK